MSFFNIEDRFRSVVILIDASASMFGRTGDLDYSASKLVRKGREQAFQVIRDEAMKLIDQLSVNARFGIVHWSGSARSWRETLVPATPANRAEAKRHLQDQVDYNKAGPRGGVPVARGMTTPWRRSSLSGRKRLSCSPMATQREASGGALSESLMPRSCWFRSIERRRNSVRSLASTPFITSREKTTGRRNGCCGRWRAALRAGSASSLPR